MSVDFQLRRGVRRGTNMGRQNPEMRLNWILGMAAIALALGAGPLRAQDATKPHLGVWDALGYEYRGQKPIAATLIWIVRDDGTIELTAPKTKNDRPTTWKYTVDASKQPHEIDLIPTEGPLTDKVLKGIYKIEKNVLTVCYPKGDVKNLERLQRPASFDLSRRDDLQILRLKRTGDSSSVTRAKPDSNDLPAVVFTALSDDFTVNGLNAAGKRDAADFGRAIASSDAKLAALASDARELMAKRLKLRLATDAWRRSAISPEGITEEFAKKITEEFRRKDAPPLDERNFADDFITLLQTSGPNRTRVAFTVELLRHLEKVQTESLPPVLHLRFPKASADGGSATMAVKLEKKLPAEMTLNNTGTKPLHNVVVWFRIEMNRLPDFTNQEWAELELARKNGFPRSAFTKVENKALQNWALELGSRNIVFIQELKPKESARITYELGTIRYSKRAVFSIYSDELKVVDQEIAGVREMQQAIEKSFGGKK
jgi:uncharacterized protein (TIGR03067 family)